MIRNFLFRLFGHAAPQVATNFMPNGNYSHVNIGRPIIQVRGHY